MHDPEMKILVELAIGRIFRLMLRPCQPGDVEQYERCRQLILEYAPRLLGKDTNQEVSHGWS